MFLHDAYGGHGGISRNNRDVLDALVHDPRVQHVAIVARDAAKAAISVMEKHHDPHRASRRLTISAASRALSRQNQGRR